MSLAEQHREKHARTSPPTLVDCGCRAIVYQDGSGVEIEYCPLHDAAPDLLAACKAMMKAHVPQCVNPGCETCLAADELCFAAIAKAEGRTT